MTQEKIHLIHLPQKLVDAGIVDSLNQARTTMSYAVLWMCGQQFDFDKKQVQVHRARLRQLNIDIKEPYSGVFYAAEDTRKMLGLPLDRPRKNARKPKTPE